MSMGQPLLQSSSTEFPHGERADALVEFGTAILTAASCVEIDGTDLITLLRNSTVDPCEAAKARGGGSRTGS